MAREELQDKVSNYSAQIRELELIIKKVRLDKEEQAKKYEVTSLDSGQKDSKILILEEKVKLAEIDRDQMSIKLTSYVQTLESERAEREQFEKAANERYEQLKLSEDEVKLSLDVMKQLEA